MNAEFCFLFGVRILFFECVLLRSNSYVDFYNFELWYPESAREAHSRKSRESPELLKESQKKTIPFFNCRVWKLQYPRFL